MKNIHILLTEKPSRFSLNSSGKYHLTNQLHTNSPNFTNQHIYITSDEDIKDGDYAYHKIFGVGKIINIYGEDCFVTIRKSQTDGSVTTPWKRNIPDIKKIILTTNPDLVVDGVQAIDDEFLEWFTKNPSCEYVEVKHKFDEDWSEESGAFEIDYYKIIIPKEEPKQELNFYERLVELLTDFLVELNEKGLIPNDKFVFSEEAEKFLKQKKQHKKYVESLSQNFKKVNILISESNIEIGTLEGFCIAENPEYNLFPTKQYKALKRLLLSFRNVNLVITTNSPYILTSINNLIQAHITGTKEGNEEKVNAIIDKKYWLDPKDVSAYMLKFEEGVMIAENILDEDGLIRAEKIDGISRILNEEFDRLLDIEIQNS